MIENKKKIPETKTLTDAQLEKVTGGENVIVISQPMRYKRCAADPTHLYPSVHDACPTCGSREFTYD